MESQAIHLQDATPGLRSRATVLAITSGKGGVGKTNIAANLAITMAAAGKKVLLLDADFSLGNLDVIMDLNSKYNISHLISGARQMAEIIHPGPEGVEVICGASGLEQLADISEFQRQRILHELNKLQSCNDAIVIDTAAGISQSVVAFCLAADHVLVVTTPEAAAMTDAYAAIKVLARNRYCGKISIVVNMAENLIEGKRTYQQIANVARRFLNVHVYEAAILPKDKRLSMAVRLRKPVVLAFPDAAVTSAMKTLAAKLGSSSIAKDGDGFFRKVVDWFF